MRVTCGLGPYNSEFMTEVKREIMTRYRVDGIFINRWDGSGMCYCGHCQRNTKFAGVLHNERWLKPVEEIYRRYAEWEPYLRDSHPLARVGLVYSQQTAWFHGARVEDHILGWYQALIAARVLFETVHDRLFDASVLARFKTLILPNIAALSQSKCAQLRAFVVAGGGLILITRSSRSICDRPNARKRLQRPDWNSKSCRAFLLGDARHPT
jgi:hypothetical protein